MAVTLCGDMPDNPILQGIWRRAFQPAYSWLATGQQEHHQSYCAEVLRLAAAYRLVDRYSAGKILGKNKPAELLRMDPDAVELLDHGSQWPDVEHLVYS